MKYAIQQLQNGCLNSSTYYASIKDVSQFGGRLSIFLFYLNHSTGVLLCPQYVGIHFEQWPFSRQSRGRSSVGPGLPQLHGAKCGQVFLLVTSSWAEHKGGILWQSFNCSCQVQRNCSDLQHLIWCKLLCIYCSDLHVANKQYLCVIRCYCCILTKHIIVIIYCQASCTLLMKRISKRLFPISMRHLRAMIQSTVQKLSFR